MHKYHNAYTFSEFQSTPSVGRATGYLFFTKNDINNFNPRPPWGGRPTRIKIKRMFAPFQSTPSVGRATDGEKSTEKDGQLISIHALRGEGDSVMICSSSRFADFNPRPPWGGRQLPSQRIQLLPHFNPRPPWGGRPARSVYRTALPPFQSTPSVGRATDLNINIKAKVIISIHALRGEGDRVLGARRHIGLLISIHALRGEGDVKIYYKDSSTGSISIHALRGEGDRLSLHTITLSRISIHALRGEGDVVRA